MKPSSLKTVIIRHRKENRKKCSLTPLEKNTDFEFICYPFSNDFILKPHVILTLDAPPLTQNDAILPLCLIDGTWNYAKIMITQIEKQKQSHIYRSLPNTVATAYPRKQTNCIDPARGLASIEALYIAFKILGINTENLLDNYFWKEDFLLNNQELLLHL